MASTTTAAQRANSKRIVISRDDWEERLADVRVDKDDLNRLVMDYLVIEGHRDAAACFARESGVAPPVDIDSIERRVDIGRAVRRGEVEEAVARVNELDPEILDGNPALYFTLQQQRMIEYIRRGEVDLALAFAQQELAPRGEENPAYLSELERTMALLAFDPSSLPVASSSSSAKSGVPAYIADLLEPAQRARTAQLLNSAILVAQGHGKDAKLPALLRMMVWGEGMLEPKADFPKLDVDELLKGSVKRKAAEEAKATESPSAGGDAMVVEA